jgi:hypothetical protein
MSVTWYTWLEQGRDVRMSAAAASRIARALHLDPAGHRYLMSLARPADVVAPMRNAAPGAISRIVDQLAPHPAYAADRTWNVIAWNECATSLLGDFELSDPARNNVLARLFLDPGWKWCFPDWQAVAQRAVAQFRVATAAYASSPDVVGLVERLRADAPEFEPIWANGEIMTAVDGEKTVRRGAAEETWHYRVMRPEGLGQDHTVTLYLPG